MQYCAAATAVCPLHLAEQHGKSQQRLTTGLARFSLRSPIGATDGLSGRRIEAAGSLSASSGPGRQASPEIP